MLSPRVLAIVIVAVSTAGATAVSMGVIFVADLVVADFTARFDNYAFAFAIPIGVSPLLVYPLVQANYRLTRMKAELERLVRTDALTGLPNRRAFFERAEALFEARERDGRPIALMIVDVDHFKLINDTFGHAAGDAVLKALAEAIARAVAGAPGGAESMVARIGGEEFAVLVAGADVAVDTVADGICRLARRARGEGAGRGIGTTVSVGVARAAAGQSLDAAMLAADTAVYEAKRQGRDRWSGPALARPPAAAA